MSEHEDTELEAIEGLPESARAAWLALHPPQSAIDSILHPDPVATYMDSIREQMRESVRRALRYPAELDWTWYAPDRLPPWHEDFVRAAVASINAARVKVPLDRIGFAIEYEAHFWCWPSYLLGGRFPVPPGYQERFVAEVRARAGEAPRDWLAEIRAALDREDRELATGLRCEAEGLTAGELLERAVPAQRTVKLQVTNLAIGTRRTAYYRWRSKHKDEPGWVSAPITSYLLSPIAPSTSNAHK